MKRLALVAVLAVLPACTTFHEDRRTLTAWNMDLIRDTAHAKPKGPCNANDWDGYANPLVNWIFVEPIAVAMLPVSWTIDTVIVNPINGWQKAELQTYNRRFGHDEDRGTSEAGVRSQQYAPAAAPWVVGDLLAVPEFTAHFLWNSLYWTDPVNKESWNTYWNEHHEQSTQ